MATVLLKTANWFTCFPEDDRWSSAVSGILSSAPYGGSDIGEVDRAARPLATLGTTRRGSRRGGPRASGCGRWRARPRRGAVGFRASAAYLRACNYTSEEGGSQHGQRDYLTLDHSVMFDWLAEKL